MLMLMFELRITGEFLIYTTTFVESSYKGETEVTYDTYNLVDVN